MKREYDIFVNNMIRHGDIDKATIAAYPHTADDCKTRRTYAGRLMKHPTIIEAIKRRGGVIGKVVQQEEERALAELAQEIKEELKQEYREILLTAVRKREILKQIAEGQLEILVRKPVWDKQQGKFVTVPVMEPPSHKDRLAAIELDNRMSGDDAPQKIQTAGVFKVVIE